MYLSIQIPCFGAVALVAHCAMALAKFATVPDASLKAGSGPFEV